MLKSELHDEPAVLLKLGAELKTNHPQAESNGVQITMVAGAEFVQEPTIKVGLQDTCSLNVSKVHGNAYSVNNKLTGSSLIAITPLMV